MKRTFFSIRIEGNGEKNYSVVDMVISFVPVFLDRTMENFQNLGFTISHILCFYIFSFLLCNSSKTRTAVNILLNRGRQKWNVESMSKEHVWSPGRH